MFRVQTSRDRDLSVTDENLITFENAGVPIPAKVSIRFQAMTFNGKPCLMLLLQDLTNQQKLNNQVMMVKAHDKMTRTSINTIEKPLDSIA